MAKLLRIQLLSHCCKAARKPAPNNKEVAHIIRDLTSRERLTEGCTIPVPMDATTHEMQFISPPIVFANMEHACAS